MKLSNKWLNDYVEINVSPKEYAERLTMSGSKVECYEEPYGEIDRVVVGKILSTEKHPDADKLTICQLDVGEEQPVQIVTGATNIAPGCIVPVALNKSTLHGGKKITSGKLRGVLSDGMLCSLGELGLSTHDFPDAIEDGILIISDEVTIGQDIKEALGLNDTVIEFEITSNRPDCLSVIGLARETAATFGLSATYPHIDAEEYAGDDVNNYISVELRDADLCPRYTAAVVKDVKIAPSPRWMRERLRASGVRPINNIVDITNFVMLEYGQPMHAFDRSTLEDGKIVIRRAAEGENITTLDGNEHPLDTNMLVIADGNRPVALAGVMGGENTEIRESTESVVFESANFNGASVRISAKKAGMRTDSSARFEKGLDSRNTMPALVRALQLVEALGAGTVVKGIIDVDKANYTERRLPLDTAWINRFLGTELSDDEMKDILTAIDFEIDGDELIVPSFRADVESGADVAEEIARFYGYNKIGATMMRGEASSHGYTDAELFRKDLHESAVSLGLFEILTYSFVSPKIFDKIRLPADSEYRNCLKISNPLGEDTSVMRTVLIPSALEVVARNCSRGVKSGKLYEEGTVYMPKGEGELPDEKKRMTVTLFGEDADFFKLKGTVEALLSDVGVSGVKFAADKANPVFHPGRCAVMTVGGEVIGTLGQIHPLTSDNWDIDVPVYVADIDLDIVRVIRKPITDYKRLPKYPAITRDLALVCDESVTAGELSDIITAAGGSLLESVKLFDIYRGKGVEEGKKSMAYSIVLRASDHTLTDTEAEAVTDKMLRKLEAAGATLRS